MKRILIALIAAIALVSATSAQNTETLTIAFIGADTDTQLYQAAVLATEQLNSDDDDEIGILASDDTRYSLEVVYYQANTSEEAQDAYNDAVADDVIAVLAAPELDITAADVITETARTVDWANAAADYLVTERKFTRVGVVAANTDEALDGVSVFRDALETDTIVIDLTHAADEDDFANDAQAIRDADTQALFVWTLDAQMGHLLTALQAVGWDGVVMYAGLDADFLRRTDSALTQNLYGTANWSAAAYDAQSQAFVADYRARWNESPSDSAAAYFDAVNMIGLAVAESGADIDLSSISDFDGVQGDILILQVQDTLIEAARYNDGVCLTCPDLWLADISENEIESSAAYTIGLIVSETAGDPIEQAVRLAIREINDLGGVIGSDNVRYTLNLGVYHAANTALEQAATDGVQIILGPDLNAQILPTLFSAEAAGIPQIVSATNTQITASEPANYVFQLRPTDQTLVRVTADYLLNVREYTHFATVAARTDYGLDAVKTFSDAVADDDDARITLKLEHDVDESDFAPLAQQIVDADVQAVAVWSTQPAAAALLTQLDALGWRGVFVYGYLTPNFLTIETSIEVLGAVNWWDNVGDWVSRDFNTRYTTRYGEAPLPQSAAYYDAVYLIATGIQATADLQGWLLETDFSGVQGNYRAGDFANGELTRSVVLIHTVVQQFSEAARYDDLVCQVGCGS